MSCNSYTSGQLIADKLGLTRASVSTRIAKLQGLGIEINTVKGRGYRLVAPVDLLDVAIIKSALEAHNVLNQFSLINVTAQTESTNTDAKLASYTDHRWQLHSTEYQTQGRGRRGKTWHSGLANSIMLSVSRRAHFPLDLIYSISLVVGVGVARTLAGFGLSATLKWPNDIYVEGKKLGGILCELHGSPMDEALVILGVGLNVTNAPSDLPIPACSLADYKVSVPRSMLVAQISFHIIKVLQEIQTTGVQSVLAEWSRLDMLFGRQITVMKGEHTQHGTAKGIDGKGELIVELNSGKQVTLNGGEVSIRW